MATNLLLLKESGRNSKYKLVRVAYELPLEKKRNDIGCLHINFFQAVDENKTLDD